MISLDKVRVESLEQRCVKLGDKESFDFTQTLVTAFLFSRYPERRQLALKDLNDYWTQRLSGINSIKIHTLAESGVLYAYVEINDQDRYSFVSKYAQDGPVFEMLPGEEEKRRWAELR